MPVFTGQTHYKSLVIYSSDWVIGYMSWRLYQKRESVRELVLQYNSLEINTMPAEVVTTSHVQKGPSKYSGAFHIKTKVESVPIGEELRLNLEYFKIIPGILKLVQLWFSRLFTAELVYTGIATISIFITAIIHLSLTARADYRYALTYYSSYLGTSFFGTYIAAGVNI
ncbi:unnamed protein product, partial [Medioppia subpectinata]